MNSKYSYRPSRIFREVKAEFFRKPLSFFLKLSLSIVLIWFGNLVWILAIYQQVDEAGQAGDLFGAANSLFTGLAFVGLIGTMIFQQRELKLQRRELRLQREEVANTRGEISAQKEQMILQNEYMQKQMFEQTFFQMLDVFNKYTDAIRNNPGSTKKIQGRDQIASLVRRIFASTAGHSLPYSRIAADYRTIYDQNIDDLGGYFRLLYNLVKYIDQSIVKDKSTYTNILRAQLSESELILISMNINSKEGEKFFPYTKKFKLLKHCPRTFSGYEIRAVFAEINPNISTEF